MPDAQDSDQKGMAVDFMLDAKGAFSELASVSNARFIQRTADKLIALIDAVVTARLAALEPAAALETAPVLCCEPNGDRFCIRPKDHALLDGFDRWHDDGEACWPVEAPAQAPAPPAVSSLSDAELWAEYQRAVSTGMGAQMPNPPQMRSLRAIADAAVRDWVAKQGGQQP